MRAVGQEQYGAAVSGDGEAVAGGGKVGGGGPQALTVGGGVGVLVRDPGGEDDVGRVEVRAQAGGALAQEAGSSFGGVQQVVQELAAYALFGLPHGAAGQLQE